jgi:hypothetical protein
MNFKGWLVSKGKGRGMKYRLDRNLRQGAKLNLRGAKLGAKLGEKLIRNITQTSVSPYLGGMSYEVYRREPSLPTSPNLKYRLTELGEKILLEK